MERGGREGVMVILITYLLLPDWWQDKRLACDYAAKSWPITRRWLRSRHFANLLAAEFVPGCKPSIANLCNFYAPMRDTRCNVYDINSPIASRASLFIIVNYRRTLLFLSFFFSFFSFKIDIYFSILVLQVFSLPPVVKSVAYRRSVLGKKCRRRRNFVLRFE